jgi:hypothetical protein
MVFCSALAVLVVLATSCGAGGGSESSSSSGQTTSAKESKATTAERTSSTRPGTTPQAAEGSPPIFPDASSHPGATNPDVTQENIESTICKSGFTKTVRPPATYTDDLKRQQMRDERLPGSPSDYEEDHLISLELGGAPKDEKNLWPEPYENKGDKLAKAGTGSETKDKVENETNKLVCSGKMTLSEAQQKIASNWYQLGVDEGAL